MNIPKSHPRFVSLQTREKMQLSVRLQGEEKDHSGVLELTQEEQTFVFVGIDAEPVPSLNRGFSAPVKVMFDYTVDQLAHLMLYDTDPVARWDASQALFSFKVAEAARRLSRGESMVRSDFYPDLLQILLLYLYFESEN